MVVRAAQHLEVKEALEGVVVEEPRAAGDVAEDVLTLGGLADLDQVVVALVGEDLLAELEHAVSCLVLPPFGLLEHAPSG